MKRDCFEKIFERLKQSLNAKSGAEIARELGVTPQAVSAFKRTGKFPSDLLIQYCLRKQISLDWLITGEGKMKLSERDEKVLTNEIPYKRDLLRWIIEGSEMSLLGKGIIISPQRKAEFYVREYEFMARDELEKGEDDKFYQVIREEIDKTRVEWDKDIEIRNRELLNLRIPDDALTDEDIIEIQKKYRGK